MLHQQAFRFFDWQSNRIVFNHRLGKGRGHGHIVVAEHRFTLCLEHISNNAGTSKQVNDRIKFKLRRNGPDFRQKLAFRTHEARGRIAGNLGGKRFGKRPEPRGLLRRDCYDHIFAFAGVAVARNMTLCLDHIDCEWSIQLVDQRMV